MKLLYVALLSLTIISCTKSYVAPVATKSTVTAVKADSVKSNIISDTDTSNPNYWYNGTTGTASIQITCTDCTAMATIGTQTIPFIFNANGVGKLKYIPAPGLSITIAVCPTGTKAIKAEVLGADNASLYSYSGIISTNWSGAYTIK